MSKWQQATVILTDPTTLHYNIAACVSIQLGVELVMRITPRLVAGLRGRDGDQGEPAT